MRSATPRFTLLLLVASCMAVGAAQAAQVSNLTALVHDGQTFLTWTCPPGTGAIYRVYVSAAPITSSSQLSTAQCIAAVGDSSAYDRRLSTLTGTPYGYVVKNGGNDLDPASGLFVVTTPLDRYVSYTVTCQSGWFAPEDLTILPGVNALRRYVREPVQTPVPVLQRTIHWSSVDAHIYTLWTSNVATPLFPAMGNAPGLAFDCAIVEPVKPGTLSSLVVLPHRKSGNLLEVLNGTGTPGEWVLALDDPVPNQDANTFWYGYHEGYDITSDINYPPIDGVVRDYTLQRIVHTLAWARSSFGIDTTRVYAYGTSMGGIGSAILAFNRPEWIAAVLSIVGKYDFSFVSDPNPESSFNTGNPLRGLADKLWGDVSTNLPTNEGFPIYHVLNDGAMAGTLGPAVSIPPIFAYNGKWDTITGWAEKIPFYGAMHQARQGGFFFWDQRDHVGTATSAWGGGDPTYLYRFRTNLSFPGITNCSADNDPGNGDPASGDSIGTINGWIEWDTLMVDQAATWGTTLRLRNLQLRGKTVTPPESVTVDVTPRRLQHFAVIEGETFHYTVTRLWDDAIVQDGVITVVPGEPFTIHGVKVYRSGSRLDLAGQGLSGVAAGATRPALQLRILKNPIVTESMVEMRWPASGQAQVELLDVSGRRVRNVFQGPVSPGIARLPLGASRLPSGLYLVSARLGGLRATAHAIVLH